MKSKIKTKNKKKQKTKNKKQKTKKQKTKKQKNKKTKKQKNKKTKKQKNKKTKKQKNKKTKKQKNKKTKKQKNKKKKKQKKPKNLNPLLTPPIPNKKRRHSSKFSQRRSNISTTFHITLPIFPIMMPLQRQLCCFLKRIKRPNNSTRIRSRPLSSPTFFINHKGVQSIFLEF